jgi:hypothetical protein
MLISTSINRCMKPGFRQSLFKRATRGLNRERSHRAVRIPKIADWAQVLVKSNYIGWPLNNPRACSQFLCLLVDSEFF